MRKVQIVLQDPFSSLNPLHTVGYHLERPLRIHELARTSGEVEEGIAKLLADVHLSPPDQFVDKYPHELSGGQRQRIALARALATRPSVILADEPVSMLDVSTRLGVLNLMRGLATERRLALLYITHDIASARYFADTTLVMYAGRLIEGGPSEIVALQPAHPYTQLLRDSAPNPEKESIVTRVAIGDPPSLIDPPAGCRFHPRCPQVMDVCRTEVPPVLSWTRVSGRRVGSMIRVGNPRARRRRQRRARDRLEANRSLGEILAPSTTRCDPVT